MRLPVFIVFFTGLLAAWPMQAAPIDLATAYQKAVEYDARLRSARADNKMYKEEKGKARSQLLPSVRVNAARGRNATEYKRFGRVQSVDYYNTVNLGFTIRQPLLNLSNIASYRQANLVSAKSDLDLRKEEASLMVRVTEAYCNALFAEDNLEFSKSLVMAAKEQLDQAKLRFKKGFGTVTDVEEAQAGYDNARAEGVDIQNNLEYTRRELEDLTGVNTDELCRIESAKFRIARPDPDNLESWIQLAMSGNIAVLAARHEVQIAKSEISKQNSARYPTIDLVAGRNYSESENNYSIGSIYDTYSISLQLSMPTYTGGYIGASVRQAEAKWVKAGEQLSWQERGVESEVRKYFNGVISNISLMQAYEQAVKSREIALIGTQKGYQAGFRSNVEVLDAQQKLFASRRNLAKSRYQYILNRFMLKQTSGDLFQADIDEVNSWLFGT